MGVVTTVVGLVVLAVGAFYALGGRERSETQEEFVTRLTRQMSEMLKVRAPDNFYGQVRVAIEVIKTRIEDGADLRFQRSLFIDALTLNWPTVDRSKLNKLLAPARFRGARA